MKKMKARICLVLSLVMLLSMMAPMAAFAETPNPQDLIVPAGQGAIKNIEIKFMDGTTVVATGHITLGEGEEQVLTPAALTVLLNNPDYALVNETDSLTVRYENAEARVAVKYIKPAPQQKNVPIKFMTDATTVVETRYVTVTDQGGDVTLRAADLAVLLNNPNYELIDNENSVTVNFNSSEARVLVKAVKQESDSHRVRVNYVTESGRKVGSEFLDVKKGTNVIMPSDLKGVPEGYKLVNTNGQNIVDTTDEIDFLVEEIDQTPIEFRQVRVNYVTESGRKVGSERLQVKNGTNVIMPSDLKNIPEGYKLVNTNGQNIVDTTDEIDFLVEEIDQTPIEFRQVRVNYVTESGRKVGSERLQVKNGTNVIMPSDLKNIPEGYKLVNTNGQNIVDTTREIDFLVEEIDQTPIVFRQVRVNYVTESGRKVGSERLNVKNGTNVIMPSDLKHIPEGYKLVNTNGQNIVDTTREIDFLVEEIDQTPIVFRQVRVNYVTESGRKVGSERLNVKNGTNVIMPSDLKHIPEGYKLVNTNGQNIVDTTCEIDFLVEEIDQTPIGFRQVRVNYVTESGRKVGSERLQVKNGTNVIMPSDLKNIPEGYKLVNTNGQNIVDTTREIDFLVEEIDQTPIGFRQVRVNYVTESGRKVGSERLQVKNGTNVIMPSDLKRIPEGYKLVNTNGQNIVDTTREIDFLVEKIDQTPIEFRQVRVNYVTESGRKVGSERLQVKNGTNVIMPSDLKRIPEGYKLVNTNGQNIVDTTNEIDFLVEKIAEEKDVRVNYVTESGRHVGSETVKAESPYFVNKEDLKQFPEGYEFVSISANDEAVTVVVKENETPLVERNLTINYVLYNGTVVGSEIIVVNNKTNVVRMSDLKKIPEGYKLVNGSDRNILPTTNSLDVLVEANEVKPAPQPQNPGEKIIFVNYTTREGQVIQVSTMVVPGDALNVSVKNLKDIPYGYELISTGALRIDATNSIYPVVAACKIDPKKDSVPKTGDDFNIVLWGSISMVAMAVAAAVAMKVKFEDK